MKILGATPPPSDFLNQKLWKWGQQSVIYKAFQDILMHAQAWEPLLEGSLFLFEFL